MLARLKGAALLDAHRGAPRLTSTPSST